MPTLFASAESLLGSLFFAGLMFCVGWGFGHFGYPARLFKRRG